MYFNAYIQQMIKYPAAIHTSNIVYTTFLHNIRSYSIVKLYQLGTRARAYKAFSPPSHVIVQIISYIALCSYYLFTSTQKDRQAPTIKAQRVQFTKIINKHKRYVTGFWKTDHIVTHE